MDTEGSAQIKTHLSTRIHDLRVKGIVLWNDSGHLRYRAKKGSMSPDIIQFLKENKSTILAQIPLHPPEESTETAVEKRSSDFSNWAPLSFGQQRLWFLHQLNPNNDGAYNIPETLRLKGTLSTVKLQEALTILVSRHEALRVKIVDSEQGAYQQLIADVDVTIDVVDLSELPLSQALEDATNTAHTEVRTGFDLETGPLIRVRLLKLENDDHILLLTLHHIIADGWSKAILTKELMALYNQNNKAEHTEGIQYLDYACWQALEENRTGFEPHKSYWLEQLKDLPPLMELPLDHSRPKQRSSYGTSHFVTISNGQIDDLAVLAKHGGCSLFMILLTAFNILLMRYCNRTDIIVGTNVANREKTEIEDVVGFFVNTLVLRNDLAGNPSFAELLQKVKSSTLSAFSHQGMPFEKLVYALQPERNFSFEPLVQIMFVLQNVPTPELKLGDLNVTPIAINRKSTKFDLSLIATKTDDGLLCEFEYSLDLYLPETIARLADNFLCLVTSVIGMPDLGIESLPLISQKEKEQLTGFQQAEVLETSYSNASHIIELWNSSLAKHGDKPAVTDDNVTISYRKLDELSDKIGANLVNQRLGQNAIVGLCLERSAYLVAAVLGVLKSGAAFLPLDINQPQLRLKHQINDARVNIILVDPSTEIMLAAISEERELVNVNDTLASEMDQTVVFPPVHLSDLAYVLYTSGSAGTPKGSLIEHRNVGNLTEGLFKLVYDRYQHATTVALLANIIFDASIQQIFGTLIHGHRLLIVSDELKLDTNALINHLNCQGVALCDCTPSLLGMFVTQDEVDLSLLQLDYLLVGGEMLHLDLVRSFYQRTTRTRLINVYGPTECCVDVAANEIHPDKLPIHQAVPIGKPLSNTQLLVLDNNCQLQPIGVPGQIAIAGQSVGRGYLSNIELTKTSFPYLDDFGSRVYLSGDRGRWLPSGELQLIDRMDRQVKLRGYRLELGEIESCLMQISSISSAAVILRESDNTTDLIAYICSTENNDSDTHHFSSRDIRQKLADYLPNYMIPAHFIALKEMPLTSSKKIDFHALPPPESRYSLKHDSRYVAATTAQEKALEEIWSDILGLEKIGIEDSFFALGGDSIKALQIVTKLRKLDYKMEIKQIFEYQSISRLAPQLRPISATKATSSPLTSTSEYIPLTAIQAWFLYTFKGNYNHYNQSLILTPLQKLEETDLVNTLIALISHHSALRHKFVFDGLHWRQKRGGNEQVIDRDFVEQHVLETVNLQHIDHLRTGDRISEYCATLQASFNISNGCLFRVALFELSDKTQRVVFVGHHLICDAVSWRILLSDFSQIYSSPSNGEDLLDTTIPFGQWALAMSDIIDGTNNSSNTLLLDDLAFWNRQEHTRSEQYHDIAPVEIPSKGSITSTAVLDGHRTNDLLTTSNTCYNTQTSELLIVALLRTLKEVTTFPPQLLLEGHGRESMGLDLDISRTVGWFTSLFPLKFDIDGQHDLSGQIKIVKETLRAVPNRGASYGLLRYTQGLRSKTIIDQGDYPPLPRVAFNYLGQFDNDLGTELFSIAEESTGPNSDPLADVINQLEVVIHVINQELHLRLAASSCQFSQSELDAATSAFEREIINVVNHTSSPENGELTPSDIDYDGFDLDELDDFISQLS